MLGQCVFGWGGGLQSKGDDTAPASTRAMGKIVLRFPIKHYCWLVNPKLPAAFLTRSCNGWKSSVNSLLLLLLLWLLLIWRLLLLLLLFEITICRAARQELQRLESSVAKSERLAQNVLQDLRSMRSNSRATELRSEVRLLFLDCGGGGGGAGGRGWWGKGASGPSLQWGH